MGLKKFVVGAVGIVVVVVPSIFLLVVFLKQPNQYVAADVKECRDIGRDILKRGGSAVDAAVAVLLCLPLYNPHWTGIGGGSMFTIRENSGNVTIISSRATVPKVFNPAVLNCSFQPARNKSIGVPGEIRGFEEAHRLYGKLQWADLFQPAIKLAREGVKVSRILEYHLQKHCPSIDALPLCQVFYHKNRTRLKHNDMVTYEKLAATLEVIAEQGADAFYNGTIGRALINDIKSGILSMEDLQSFKVKKPGAWNVSLGEYKMFFPPPPSGGALIGLILNVMKGYNLTSNSMKGDQQNETYQRYVEACKFALGQRKYIRDLDFSPHKNAAHRLLTEEFAKDVRSKINDSSTQDPSYYDLTSSLDPLGTAHVSVIADDGTAVSVTSTINRPFGSLVYSPNTGIILNDQLADFCENGAEVDRVSAGEQPPSTTAPSVLYSEREMLVIGGAGGTRITTRIAMAIMNYLWFGKDLKQAIEDRVVFVETQNVKQTETFTLQFEKGFNQAVKDGLKNKGHSITEEFMKNGTAVNGVLKKGSSITAWSDSRRQD
ncbi:hypothetical protein MATL_G00058060 [Megalops atlanticus]|uniref:Uncharacterized protein n=1 Tax=Megalops atlanticus TaxID=7932 RepID=A0A9D3QA03_MEGAT|nr:hypothetical protein MATL_G00058060 [Megalops atlanticus]